MRKRQTIVIVVLLCIIFLETLILNYFRSELYEITYKVASINEETRVWNEDNDALRQEIMKQKSFTQLSDQAKKAGFVPAKVQFLLP